MQRSEVEAGVRAPGPAPAQRQGSFSGGGAVVRELLGMGYTIVSIEDVCFGEAESVVWLSPLGFVRVLKAASVHGAILVIRKTRGKTRWYDVPNVTLYERLDVYWLATKIPL
ncbi:MAG: hypothetical protein DRJ67_12060, partial [Thermoprotei archaeon]